MENSPEGAGLSIDDNAGASKVFEIMAVWNHPTEEEPGSGIHHPAAMQRKKYLLKSIG
jgi:hypothetical protein